MDYPLKAVPDNLFHNIHRQYVNTISGLCVPYFTAVEYCDWILMPLPPKKTCPCSSVVNALERHVQWSVSRLRSRVQSSVWAHPPSTKELFLIIPMHMMNREIIPGRKKRFECVLCNLWPLQTPCVAASRLLAAPVWLKLKGVAGHWLVQHTAPVRAKPDGRTRSEGARYKYTNRFFWVTRFLFLVFPYYSFPCRALD